MALRAIVSSNNLRAVVDTDSLEPVTVFQNIKSLTNFIDLEYGINFLNLKSVDIVLDADSKNLFFTPEFRADQVQNVTITESLAKAITTDVTDSIDEIGFIDLPSLGTAKPASDTFSVTESIVTLLIFERAFSNIISLNDNPDIATLNFGKNTSDSANVGESYASSFSKPASDTSSISESSDVVPNKILGSPPSPGTTITYTVTVAAATSGSGNRFYINGAENPTIDFEATTLYTGATYRFDQSHSSNTNHPLKFSETSNGTHNSGSEHTADPDVTYNGTPGQAGAYTEIEFAPFAGVSALHYYCANHSGMGNKINLIAPMRVEMSDIDGVSVVNTFLRAFTDAASLDDTASASDDLATESGINKNNVVSVAESLGPFTVSKPLTDTATVSENININGENQFSDSSTISDSPSISFAPATVANSVSVSESINVQLIAGGTSGALLNKSALNTYSINS
jgi:hypothetical protein